MKKSRLNGRSRVSSPANHRQPQHRFSVLQSLVSLTANLLRNDEVLQCMQTRRQSLAHRSVGRTRCLNGSGPLSLTRQNDIENVYQGTTGNASRNAGERDAAWVTEVGQKSTCIIRKWGAVGGMFYCRRTQRSINMWHSI